LFTLSEEEQAAVQREADIATERSTINQQIRQIAYTRDAISLDLHASLEARLKALDQSELNNTRSPTFVTAQVKTLVNQFIEQKLPMPPADALTVAEQLLPTFMDSPETLRFAALFKDLLVRALKVQADPDLNAARALGTAARYKALCDTGLPESFVQNLIVAEASRPLPNGLADIGQKISTIAGSSNTLRLH